jgi:hypothetical protein
LKVIGGGEVAVPPLRWGSKQKVLFEDLVPGANWSHPARFKVVDESGQVLSEIPSELPPQNLAGATVVGGDAFGETEAPVDFHIEDFQGRYRVKNPSRFHALFINGNGDRRHWNDMAFFYRVLTRVYGYNPSQIYVADSTNRDGAASLGGDGVPSIRYGSTVAEVKALLDSLRQTSQREDQLLVVVNDHGSMKDKEPALVLYDGQLKASELGGLIKALPPDRVISVFAQCFSGGFVRPSVASKRVSLAAATDAEYSWATPDFNFDEFLYHLIAAFGHQTHDGKPVNADRDGDGRVSAQEAFAYAVGQDRTAESPLLESLKDTGMQRRIGIGF